MSNSRAIMRVNGRATGGMISPSSVTFRRFSKRALKADGQRVLMIGDGLNDSAALCEAHVSISPSSALDAARSASDIVFLGENLDQLVGLIPLAKASQKRITENFRIATFYNVIAVPVAIAGFATPLIAALAMSLSSISVTLNALRIR